MQKDEEMDLSLKRKYESDIAELQQANETLKADMDSNLIMKYWILHFDY